MARHINRQCGPRGPNSGTKTSEKRKEVNRRCYWERAELRATQEMVFAMLKKFASQPCVAVALAFDPVTQEPIQWIQVLDA